MNDQKNTHSVELLRHLPPAGTNFIAHSVKAFNSVSSTNEVAKKWALQGAPHGGLVIAETQVAGRGRQDRTWESEDGVNLTFSLVLRPRGPASEVSLIPLMAGLSVAQALEDTYELDARLKWPNDVLIDDRKCAGILAESVWPSSDEAPSRIILGIGLNVNQQQFPAELEYKATSIARVLGEVVDRSVLLTRLLARLEGNIAQTNTDAATLIQSCESRLIHLDAEVNLQQTNTGDAISGKCRGISRSGALVIETSAGTRHFHAGDVTLHATHYTK